MFKKDWFRWRGVKVAAAATEEIAFPRVEPGRHYHITRVAVENETSTSTDVRILVRGHGWDHYIEEKDTLAADTLYRENEPFHLSEGEDLVAKFTGVSVNDDLRFYVEGYWLDQIEEG